MIGDILIIGAIVFLIGWAGYVLDRYFPLGKR